jgi:HK97 gp10 family phage protein
MAFRKGRGQFTAPVSRTGRGFNYAGRSVRISGDKFTLTWNGPQVIAEVLNALVGAFSNLSDSALSYMQSIVPVDTSELQDSCFVQVFVVGERIRIAIGAGARHAIFVELGTSKTAAQPFIRPTYDFVVRSLPQIIRAEVKRRGR